MPSPTHSIPATGRDTVATRLVDAARRHPAKPFLLFEEQPGRVLEISYAEMVARAERAAGRLAALGVAYGSRVHLHLDNSPFFYDAWFGCAFLGAAIVPTNPLSTSAELVYVIADAGCTVSVTREGLLDAVRPAQPGTTVLAAGLAAPSEGSGSVAVEPVDVDPLDLAAVLYTSGTTSAPKGVMVSHANYVFVGEVVADHVRLRPDDRWLVTLPLFHANAQYYCTMSAITTGASIALAPAFSASGWSRQAALMEATVASLFAAPIRMLLATPPQPDDERCALRFTLFAQNLLPDQVSEFERRFGTALVQLYGMTETIAPPTMNPVTGGARSYAVGRPLPHARLRLVDEDGRDVAEGEPGELLVHGVPGRTIMAGYLGKPELTAEAMPDGWLHTGDLMRADEDGYLLFVDRVKDMIKRSGENVSAGEVEQLLNEHPAVMESAVLGVPDAIRDEAIVGFVVLHDGASADSDELRAWAAARLSSFKVPEVVHVIDALPRTSVGKIRKTDLRPLATRD